MYEKIKRLPLSFKLIGGFIVIAMICLALSLYSVNRLGALGGYFDKAYIRAVTPLERWAQFKLGVSDIKSLLNYHVAEQDLKNQEKIETDIQRKFKSTDELLKKLEMDAVAGGGIVKSKDEVNPDGEDSAIDFSKASQEKILAAIKLQWGEIGSLSKRIVEQSKNFMKEDAVSELNTGEGHALFSDLDELSTIALDRASDRVKEFRDQSIELRDKVRLRLIIGSVLAIALSLGAGFILARNIVAPINRIIQGLDESSDQVASASGQVSSTSQQLAEGSNVQAASIEETSSSLEEMSTMIIQNADNVNHADKLMKDANQVVVKANNSLSELTNSMEEIFKASEETSKIIKTIDEIAFQTNLLALNAAVEAARAGEAGAGFAVVADEVRNLAMRAAGAARNTADLIEGTVKKVHNGVELVAATREAFTEVAASASKEGELVGEIAEASNEQARGIEQVNNAVTDMDRIVRQNASNAEENAGASEKMSAQAEQMKEYVGELVAIVGGGGNEKGNGRTSMDIRPETTGHETIIGLTEKLDEKALIRIS